MTYRGSLDRSEDGVENGMKERFRGHDATHPVQQDLRAMRQVIVVVDYAKKMLVLDNDSMV